jgi:hypothetical protein
VVSHFINYGLTHLGEQRATDDDKRVWLDRLRTMRWREVATNLALFYDFEYLGAGAYTLPLFSST